MMTPLLRSVTSRLNRIINSLLRKPMPERIQNKVTLEESDILKFWGLLNINQYGNSSTNPALSLKNDHNFPHNMQEMFKSQILNYFPSFGSQIDIIHELLTIQLTTLFSQFISDPTTFESPVIVKESNIPNAGLGIFSTKPLNAGEIVALYPGTSYLPSEHHKLQGFPSNTSPYITCRFDNIIIDASKEAQVLTDSYSKDSKDLLFPRGNPLAIGQFFNHPPNKTLPTVFPVSFDFTDIFWELNLDALIPNKPYSKSVWSQMTDATIGTTLSSKVTRSLVFIVSNDTEQQCELFFNYRYNPRIDLPDWYSPVNVVEDHQRWNI